MKGIDNIKRWIVHKYNKELKLYYNTLEEAKQNNPDCQISEYHDDSHIQYINKINSLSTETLYDYRNRPLLKIPHNAGYILVRLCLDQSDGVYYDYLEYQRHDEFQHMPPIGFVSSTPERFVKLFLSDLDKDIEPYRLSNKEIKKTKAKRFYNKNNKAYWVDSNKYLYFASKRKMR